MSKIYKLNKINEYSLWDYIKKIGKIKSEKDIEYVNGDYLFDDCQELYEDSLFNGNLKKFIEIAKKYNYTSEYGNDALNLSLEIVLKNGSWIEVSEYDGQNFLTLKEKPEQKNEY